MSENKKPKCKYSLSLTGTSKVIKLHKVSQINLSDGNDKEFIYIEKLKSGDWIMAYTASTIEDIEKLKSIEIIEEN